MPYTHRCQYNNVRATDSTRRCRIHTDANIITFVLQTLHVDAIYAVVAVVAVVVIVVAFVVVVVLGAVADVVLSGGAVETCT